MNKANELTRYKVQYLSWKYHLINYLGGILKKDASWSDAKLMRKAERKTGLTDWGDDGFRIPFNILLRSFETESRFHTLGRLFARIELIKRLTNRLKIQDTLKKYPEIQQVNLPKLMVITGMARSGTTLLHRLMAQDPTTRTLQYWEAEIPCPPPDPMTYETDPRRQLIRKLVEGWLWLSFKKKGGKHFHSMHPSGHDIPEECRSLLRNSFMIDDFFIYSRVPGYLDWVQKQDMTNTYQYYHRQLQILLWHLSGDRLVVKAPQHLPYVDMLLKIFPDVHIIWTHRDPLIAVPSLSSLLTSFYISGSHRVDLKEMGDTCFQWQLRNVKRAMETRESADPSRFIDVDYLDLVKDPIGIVQKIYSHIGADLPDETKIKMKAWLAENSQYKYGRHQYDLETFGLDASEISRQFSEYCKRFNIQPE